MGQLRSLWKTPEFTQESKEITGNSSIKFLWKFLSNREFRQNTQKKLMSLQGKYLANVSNTRLSQLFRLEPLSEKDKATRYLVAGQITDLIFKNPNYLDHVLKAKNGYPLRFIITKDSPTLGLGSYLNGQNIITLNKTFLWLPKGKSSMSSFTHPAGSKAS